MKQFKNVYVEMPSEKQLIFWLGPTMKEVLGFFIKKQVFIECDGTFKGYCPKYWRPAAEEDNLLCTWFPDSVPKKKKKK